MTLSSLQRNLDEFKEKKIDELHQYNAQLINELELEFENKQKETEEKINKITQDTIHTYTNQTLNSAKLEAKQIELSKRHQETLILSHNVFEDIKPQFEHIIKTIITNATQILNCNKKDLIIVTSKEHYKEFENIISKSQLNAKQVKNYYFECHYKSQLIRFDLREYIKEFVQHKVNLEVRV